MTENEAIEELKYDCNELGKAIPCDTSWGKSFENAYAMAIKALEEVQQYRKIGTPEELQTMKEHGGFTGVELAQIAAGQMKLKEYQAIGTVEECRAAIEKQVAMKKYCDEEGCLNCPYHNPLLKEDKCMNDFVADGSNET